MVNSQAAPQMAGGSVSVDRPQNGTPLFATPTDHPQLLALLQWHGLTYDPFSILDAGADPHLSDYLVGYDSHAHRRDKTLTQALEAAWGDWPALIFAPVGGGKSALRVNVAQTCFRQEANQPFAISYEPPFLKWGTAAARLEDHLLALAQAGAEQLLLALAYRPHWYLSLERAAQQLVQQFLVENLPGPLSYYVDDLRASFVDTPPELFEPHPIFAPLPRPDTPALLELCRVLPAQRQASSPPSPLERWQSCRHALTEALNFRAVYVLLDGLDATPETAANPAIAVQSVASLLELIPGWSQQKIFIKGFLPQETRPLVARQHQAAIAQTHLASIAWTRDLLAELLRRRVYAATLGEFNTLDAMASPALREIEMLLVNSVAPLPREVLVITRQVLIEHLNHTGPAGKIQEQDIQAALTRRGQSRQEGGTYA